MPSPHRSAAARAALVAAAGVVACSDPATAVLPDDLVGRWTSGRQTHLPTGTFETILSFGRSGRFSSEVRSRGVYPGQPADELSAYTVHAGTVEVAGDRATFRVDSIVSWDRFYGASSRPTVQRPSPYGVIYDAARVRVSGRELAIDFLAYPLDAPEPARAVFRRID